MDPAIPDEFDVDFDPDLDLEPLRPRLENVVKAGHPFSLCWSHEVRSILSGLNSGYLTHPWGPWIAESPFVKGPPPISTFIPDSLGDGGISSSGHYRDSFSTSSESSNEHLSAALGITVGYPFLSATATGEYDRRVSENRNGIKASRNASCRTGRIVLQKTPTLSPESIKLLRSPDGQRLFRLRYGDFYICGYSLGADAGACMSATTQAKSSAEVKKILIAVKTLFSKHSVSKTEIKSMSKMSANFTFSGYSTLDETPPCSVESSSTSTDKLLDLHHQANECLDKVQSLQATVHKLMEELGVVEGARLSSSDCIRLCESGLVVELLLAPFARLNQYIESI